MVRLAIVDDRRDRGRGLPVTDELAVRTSARREALRRNVQAFEQIRFPRAVLTHNQDESGRKFEVECRVRTEATERESADDQPASRIGMMRYV